MVLRSCSIGRGFKCKRWASLRRGPWGTLCFLGVLPDMLNKYKARDMLFQKHVHHVQTFFGGWKRCGSLILGFVNLDVLSVIFFWRCSTRRTATLLGHGSKSTLPPLTARQTQNHSQKAPPKPQNISDEEFASHPDGRDPNDSSSMVLVRTPGTPTLRTKRRTQTNARRRRCGRFGWGGEMVGLVHVACG